jgi:hypothetical protein
MAFMLLPAIAFLIAPGENKRFYQSYLGKKELTACHPVKNMNIKTLRSIERQSGLKF